MECLAGLEPAWNCLEGSYSVQLSYRHAGRQLGHLGRTGKVGWSVFLPRTAAGHPSCS